MRAGMITERTTYPSSWPAWWQQAMRALGDGELDRFLRETPAPRDPMKAMG